MTEYDSRDLPGPTRDADVWAALARWRGEGRTFVLATVVESRGFTPRKPGARMLIAVDGATVGTIGGGAIEREVIERAHGLMSAPDSKASTAFHRHLTQELGMCCGGEMTVFLERLEPPPKLWVFGAGYIAKPLAAIAAGCGFEVTVVDGREEWATPERFPTSTVVVRDPEDVARTLVRDRQGRARSAPSASEISYAIIVTHDHALDQKLVQVLLRQPLHFVGMIGSIPKQRKFALRLRARGFSDEEIARLHTPLGLPIGAATPEEIAVSVVAQLIAVRRGAKVDASWTPRLRAGNAGVANSAAEPAL
jgi:xanthine dehydrogenase accessory factor